MKISTIETVLFLPIIIFISLFVGFALIAEVSYRIFCFKVTNKREPTKKELTWIIKTS